MHDYQVVTESFACLIVLDDNSVIIEAAPLLRKFKGQNLRNLISWMQRNFTDAKIINLKIVRTTCT